MKVLRRIFPKKDNERRRRGAVSRNMRGGAATDDHSTEEAGVHLLPKGGSSKKKKASELDEILIFDCIGAYYSGDVGLTTYRTQQRAAIRDFATRGKNVLLLKIHTMFGNFS
jgi:hypothetical protein